MRYIGSKDRLLGFIDQTVLSQGITHGSFCDLFAGTTAVGRHFKRSGFRVVSNDLMQYSYIFGKAYLENNTVPQFTNLRLGFSGSPASLFPAETEKLEQVLGYLNILPAEQGFVYEHYSDGGAAGRMFFSQANAGKIDAIRTQIQRWRDADEITGAEYYILLATLLEAVPSISNTSGTYAAYLKFWEARSQKSLHLTVPPLLPSSMAHSVYRCDAAKLIAELSSDVIYLDPPYNSRQYATNYHVLETIARDDNPTVRGKTGLRPYQEEKSDFCNKNAALNALQQIVSQAQCQLFLLSYNSEGIMPHETICEILTEFGRLEVKENSYRRYRSDSDHAKRQYKSETAVVERLYALRVE